MARKIIEGVATLGEKIVNFARWIECLFGLLGEIADAIKRWK